MNQAEFTSPLRRRTFISAAAAGATTALATKRAAAANDKIGIGFIGYGLIGKRHVLDFRDQPDTDLAAVAEVHTGRLEEARALIGSRVRGYGDFRKLLDDRDVQAVVVSTPDHWHAPMTLLA